MVSLTDLEDIEQERGTPKVKAAPAAKSKPRSKFDADLSGTAMDLGFEERRRDEKGDIISEIEQERIASGEGSLSSLGMMGALVREFGGGTIEGLAQMTGLPADLIGVGLRSYSGLEFKDVENIPVLRSYFDPGRTGSGLVIGAARKVVPSLFDIEGTGALGRVVRRTGQEVGAAAVPGGAALGVAKSGIRTGQPLVDQILRFGRESPGKFAGAELATATGGGALAGGSLELLPPGSPGSAGLEMTAQIAGGFGVTAPAAVGRAVARGFGPVTKAGHVKAAARILQDQALDKTAAVQNIRKGGPDVPGVQFSGGQLSNDAGLLSMERSVVRAGLASETAELQSLNNQAIRAELSDIAAGTKSAGSSKVVQEFLQGRVDRLLRLLDQRTAQAVAAAQRAIDKVRPRMSQEDAALEGAEQLGRAYDDAKVQERAMWNHIYGADGVGTGPVRQAMVNIRARQLKSSDAKNVPAELEELILGKLVKNKKGASRRGGYNDTESVDELLELRSRALDAKRANNAADAPNARLNRNLNDIQEAVLDALGPTTRAPWRRGRSNANRIKAAREYTKIVHDRFTRGPIGQMLGYERSGGKKTADLLALEGLFGPNLRGAANADALIAAGGGNKRLIEVTKEFVRNKFFDAISDGFGNLIDDGGNAAARFLKRHKGFGSRYPQLWEDLGKAANNKQLAQRMASSGTRLKRNISDAKKSRAALFLEQDPARAWPTVFKSRKPVAAVDELIKQAAKDPTGEASDGLRRGFYDYLMTRVEMSMVDSFGDARVGAAAYTRFMKDSVNKRVMDRLYSKDQMRRFNIVKDALNTLERTARSVVRGGSDTAQNVNILAQVVGRVVGGTAGAKIGKLTGASPLVIASTGARYVRKLIQDAPEREIRRLLEQAIMDPEAMKTMLMIPTRKNTEEVIRRLRGHLLNLSILHPDDQPTTEELLNAPTSSDSSRPALVGMGRGPPPRNDETGLQEFSQGVPLGEPPSLEEIQDQIEQQAEMVRGMMSGGASAMEGMGLSGLAQSEIETMGLDLVRALRNQRPMRPQPPVGDVSFRELDRFFP